MFRLRVDDEIELRLPEEHQAPEVVALVRESLSHLQKWLPWVTADITAADTRELYRRNRKQYRAREAVWLHIIFRGRIAGSIGLNHIDWLNRRAEVGYWLGSRFQGHGIMTRSCRALIDHAFNEMLLNRVEILCAVENRRSRRVPERLGFKRDGTLREAEWVHDHFKDLVVYSMLAREWES